MAKGWTQIDDKPVVPGLQGYPQWNRAKDTDWLPVFLKIELPDGADDKTGPVALADAALKILRFKGTVHGQQEYELVGTDIIAIADGKKISEIRHGFFATPPALRDLVESIKALVKLTILAIGYPVLAVEPAASLAFVTALERVRGTMGGRFNIQAYATALRKSGANLDVTTLPLVSAAVGVIDDGLPFLNRRFRATEGKTRIREIWLQADAKKFVANVPAAIGRVLLAQDINTLIHDYPDETDAYRLVNDSLYPITQQQSTNTRVSHGAHVMDVAAGADFRDFAQCDAKPLPIFGVQLPPASVIDTSGRRFEPMVIMGLRWLLTRVLAMAVSDGAKSHLVVSLSLGSLAGPGDATNFLGEWMVHEIARYQRLTQSSKGTKPGQMRVAVAYGNARRQKLVGRAVVKPRDKVSCDWRIKGDSYAPSFLELRLRPALGPAEGVDLKRKDITVTLTPPNGAVSALVLPWDCLGNGWQFCADAGIPAMVLPLDEKGQDILIALAPTARIVPGEMVQPGCWRIAVANAGAGPALMSLRVQRADTPMGYRVLGRQSYLEDAAAFDWDDETLNWVRPQPESVVSRQGTCVAYAGTGDQQGIYFVGAIKPMVGKAPEAYIASLASASGSDPLHVLSAPPAVLSDGPSLAAMGDDGAQMAGRRASGVRSGAIVRVSGSSVAAAAVTRRLAMWFRDPGNPHTDLTAETDFLLKINQGIANPIAGKPPKDKSALTGTASLLVGYGPLRGQRAYTPGADLAP